MDKAFVKGLNLLTALAESGEARSLSGLADQLGLTRSNTHRLLQTLIALGFARQDGEKGLYAPTLRLWELGAHVIADLDVVELARQPMRDLSAATGETVHLSVLEGAEVIYLDKIEGTQAVRAYTHVGARAPAWAVATGKAMLAHDPDAEDRLIAAAPHRGFTPRTLTDAESLRQELAAIRAAGIAFNHGEWRADVCGAAAPIRDAQGRAIAAIGISGPAIRLDPDQLAAQADRVRAAAGTTSQALGWRGAI